MKHEKILDRISKLLSMAGDKSSPQEAAIAAGRARKLMDKYQVSELELSTVSSTDMGSNTFKTTQKTAVSWIGVLAVAVARLNDCQVQYDNSMNIKFNGMLVDTVCAVELQRYLMKCAYDQAVKYRHGRRDRNQYRTGFAAGVAEQVKEILKERASLKDKSGTALVVVKNQLVRQHFGATHYRSTKSYTRDGAFSEGYHKGKTTSLNRQVNGSAQGRLQ